MVEFRVLGTLDVIDGGRSVQLRRSKPRALLAMLVLHPNEVISADRLVDGLWGDRPPPSAANTLQGYVSHLRQAIGQVSHEAVKGPFIRTQAPGYVLVVDPEQIDAHRFERLVAEGRRALARSDAQGAAASFGSALSLWKGPALADLVDERFAAPEAARLEQLRMAAIEEQAEAELALGRHFELVCRLEALVGEHPLRERLWAQLMLAMYRCGRQADALRVFQTARRNLAEELGIEPGPALRRMEADILTQALSLEWSPSPASPGTTGGARRALVPFPGLLSLVPSVDYVGRDELLSALADAGRRAAAGSCCMVLLAGEPGMGKTRTAAEVARAEFAKGAIVLYGRCDEEMGVPYQPFAEALDWYTAHDPDPVLGSHPAELRRLHPLLASRVAGLAPPVSSDPRSEEYLLFEATSSWLIELARHQPLVLVLDDLHWASRPVLLLLRHALRAAAAEQDGVPLLVVGTYRDTEVERSHPLANVAADLRRLPGVNQWSIAGLSLAETQEFVSRVVGQELDDNTRRLAGTLHAETEGNPFFIDEVLRHLVETGTVQRSDNRWVVAEHATVSVPQGVRDVVGRRLERLSRPANDLLAVAAVVGRDFDVEILFALSDLPEERLLDALDEALAARLIEETGADGYRFTHALVRATLSEELSGIRRRRVHWRVAEAIEKLRPDDVVALAYHFTEARLHGDDRLRAVRYALAAAEQALEARALADAEARFRQVLQLLAGPAQHCAGERIEALCGLGEAQRDQGDAEFRATLLEAARLAEDAGDVPLLVRAVLSNSRGVPSVIGGVDRERVILTETALEAVGPTPTAERARLLAQLAAEVTFTRDDLRRLALADEAEAMARTLGDGHLLAEVLNRTGYAAFSARRVERLVARGEEATRLSDAGDDPAQRVLSRFFWSGALLTAGEIPVFKEVTKDMLAVSEHAAPTLQWLALASQARLAMFDGDSDAVRRVSDQAFQQAQELGEPDGAAWWTATLAILSWCEGLFPAMADALRAGIEVYPDEPAWSVGYAMSLAMDGRLDEAREALRADPPDPHELVDHVFPFLNDFLCAVIAFHLDDVDLAARTQAALGPYRRFWVHHYAGACGPVAIALGLCAAVAGCVDEAVDLFEETDRLLVDVGVGLLPQFRMLYAEVLARRGSKGDQELAADLLGYVRRDAAQETAASRRLRVEGLAARLGIDAGA